MQNNKSIKDYYTLALRAIKLGRLESAKDILYNQMPAELYDTSLDILFNRNESIIDSNLHSLIKEVDEKLNQAELILLDETEVTDNFNGQF